MYEEWILYPRSFWKERMVASPLLKPNEGEPWPDFLLKLCQAWADKARQHGLESPILAVRAQNPKALELTMWNYTRWLVNRGKTKGRLN